MSLNLINPSGYASKIFDLLRFLAAFEVLIFHTHMKLVWDHKPDATWYDNLFYNITNHGHQAVIVFFVLSGYFISGSVMKTITQKRWSWKTYLTNRLTRLWLVLIPALALTALWDYVMIYKYHGHAFNGDLSWNVFAGNMVFLQGIKVHDYGQNLPLWSLNYEFWYYILFAAIALMFWKSTKSFSRIASVVIFIAVAQLVGNGIMHYFVVWLLGVVLLISPRIPMPKWIYGVVLPFSTFWFIDVIGGTSRDGTYNSDILVGVSFTITIYVVYHLFNDVEWEPKRVDIYKELSGFSYTLYVVHFPVLSVAWYFFQGGGYPSPYMMSVCVVTDVAILIYAWVIARYTERKTEQVRRYVLKILRFPMFAKLNTIKNAPTR